MGPKTKKLKRFDLTKMGYQGEGVVVPGLTPVHRDDISVIETSMNKSTNKNELERALQNTKQIDFTRENATVKQILNSSPSVVQDYPEDPFTEGREPGSGPVELDVEEVKEKLDFSDDIAPIMDNPDNNIELMDIEEEEDTIFKKGGKKRRRKMKTRKAVCKSKRGKKHSSSRKTKSKRRRTSVRRR
uniref:Uncharacterized protein n=1 Tax=viral metagenome TaxID=1070528 RepID=A0A6C0DFI9_9ZZZZ